MSIQYFVLHSRLTPILLIIPVHKGFTILELHGEMYGSLFWSLTGNVTVQVPSLSFYKLREELLKLNIEEDGFKKPEQEKISATSHSTPYSCEDIEAS